VGSTSRCRCRQRPLRPNVAAACQRRNQCHVVRLFCRQTVAHERRRLCTARCQSGRHDVSPLASLLSSNGDVRAQLWRALVEQRATDWLSNVLLCMTFASACCRCTVAGKNTVAVSRWAYGVESRPNPLVMYNSTIKAGGCAYTLKLSAAQRNETETKQL